jgi:hypothetical protein
MITKPVWTITDQYELQNSSDGCAKAVTKHDDERKNEASKKEYTSDKKKHEIISDSYATGCAADVQH